MSESLPKARSSLSTTTGIASNSYNFTKPWTTARCHRLLRPLSSKLQALRNIVQSNPSVTSGNASRPKPKHDPKDPDALFVEVVDKAVGGNGGTRTRAKPRRTYGGTGGGGGSRNSAHPPPAVAPTGTTSSTSANDSYLTIWGDPTSSAESQPPPPPKRSHQPKSQDPNNPHTLLHSLKTHVHPSIFSIYLGIYTSLESVLLSTNLPPHKTKVLPLRILAARKIAHCILATADEVESDDIWYDAAAELGCGGEYLRDVVRWHAIELIREAITDGLMKGREGGNGGIGMAGVLVGLCRSSGAEPEAQLLLQTMFDLHQIISSSNHPPIRTLQTFWLSGPNIVYRFLAANFPVTRSNPSWLGSTDIRKFLLLDLDDNPGLELLTVRAFEAAFGIWGDEHIDALSAQRREALKRKGAPRTSKSTNEVEDATRKAAAIMPYNIATKAENTVLKTAKALVLLSLQNPSSKAIGILQQLVRGFLVQDAEVRDSTEDVWGENWPVAGKIAILLQGLGSNAEDDNGIMDELARSLEDICSSGGKEALRSLASFLADCYRPLYNRVSFLGKEDPVQLVTNRLLKLAVATHDRFSPSDDEEEISELAKIFPETPRSAPGKKMVTFTPGKPALAPHQELKETKRYLVAQLALQIAVRFSLTDAVKSNAVWIDWLGRFEHKVINLKIQTPGRVKSILQSLNMEDKLGGNAKFKQKKKKGGGNEKRKGWRYEEGLDLWVSVGATPGRKEERKKGVFMECVEVEMEEEEDDWRNEYDVFASDIGDFAIGDDEPMEGAADHSSEYGEGTDVSDRPVTPASSTFSADNDDDAEFYSNLRTTPLRILRRSPRGTARIKRSLTCFSAIISSPMFSRLRTPVQVRSSGLRKQFDFSVVVGSPPADSPVVPSTEQRLGGDQGFWEDGEDEEGLRVGYSSPVLRKMGRGDDFSEDEAEEEEEGEEEEEEGEEGEEEEEEEGGDILILDMGSGKLGSPCSSPQPAPTPPSRRKRGAPVVLADLMEIDDSEVSEEDAEEEQSEEEQEAEEEVLLEDELSIATDIPLPPSSPPPPSPPPRPRRPKRTSLGALKSMININDTVASTPRNKDVMKLLGQGKKLTPSEKRCLRRKRVRMMKAAESKRAAIELSDDELGM